MPLLFCLAIAGTCHAANGINLTKALPHYARDMEFYYQKPRPEILEKMLQSFESHGLLKDAEKRLMVASFLAELSGEGKIDLTKLAGKLKNSSLDMKRALAWSAHISGPRQDDSLTSQLLDSRDPVLARQIERSPRKLEQWDPGSEKSVLQMYWGAFMASGRTKWIDSIIDTALGYARARERGASKRDLSVGMNAAASLYEYAGRHPLVEDRLAVRASQSSGPELEMLRLLMEHAAGSH